MSKSQILIDVIVEHAKINSGFVHLGSILPILRSRGLFKIPNPTKEQQWEQMRTLIKKINESKLFERAKLEEGYPEGTYKLKGHGQFK